MNFQNKERGWTRRHIVIIITVTIIINDTMVTMLIRRRRMTGGAAQSGATFGVCGIRQCWRQLLIYIDLAATTSQHPPNVPLTDRQKGISRRSPRKPYFFLVPPASEATLPQNTWVLPFLLDTFLARALVG